MRIIPGVIVGFLVVGGVARADKADKADPIAASLTKLAEAAKCSMKASPWRPWCIATDFAKGTAAPLPTKALVGMTVELEDGKDMTEALSQKVTFVALAIDKDGKVKLTDVKPENADESVTVGEAVIAATQVFKAREKTAKLPRTISTFVKTLKGAYATKKVAGSWTWEGKSTSQLRKVGTFWVIIERPAAANGIWATILTDAWE
jgi:hypothetical protein